MSQPRIRALRGRAPTAVAITAASALALGAGALAGVGASSASSHREAPLISGMPKVDGTDVYAFLSPDKAGTATLIANSHPFSDPAGGPNFFQFDPSALYDINVDTNGDGRANITYRWKFNTLIRNKSTFLYNTGPVTTNGDKDLNVLQTYSLSKWTAANGWRTVAPRLTTAPSNVGTASMPNYARLRAQATRTVGDYRVYAGQADDPFFLDLRVFNLLYGGNLKEVGNDTLKGYNVNTVALQVPVSELGGSRNIVGIWSTTWKMTSKNNYTRVSRVGMPLTNEVVIGLKDKDRFNASVPSGDAQFLNYVTKPGLPKVVEKVYGIKAPKEPRNDLVQVFLTGVPGVNKPRNVKPAEMLRLNLTPFAGQKYSRLGVIGGDLNGFPNGRRLADDVLDASLQVVEGELVGAKNDLGDGVNANDVAFSKSFPYLALPHSGSTVR